ncbi:MAG: NAD(P)H-dependent oxidoreductase [Rhodobacteraceae bacterium]|uniref:NADPH-dependent FMN reductase n=1 Tax=Celeribacter sp. HF31 TaxID=2721558 RepID=UPI001431814F|nr:NAD(P)H-dependent oxidoreductase [Celeribacter sp. HF31]NIY78336.1 NAD(P)H-dependent oxidoreductase [Celeribacter sp. HF31]NVK46015.1 NAD(P)H-dependent oxidoreductase [Paracoccaceae bacterium]
MSNPKIAIVIGSTRDARFADKPAQWLFAKVKELSSDLDFDLVDLKDYELPMFNEMASNLWMPSSDEKAVAWQEKMAEYDGYIFLTPEYNSSIPASLKNALDQAGKEWVRKPAAVFGYGAVGGARAVEHLRAVVINLQMVPVRSAVYISGSDFFKVSPLGANAEMSEIEAGILPSVEAMLGDLTWWTKATKAAREA